jgi:VanZ family protein
MIARLSRRFQIAAAILLIYWGAIFVGTHVPGSMLGEPKIWDKALHFLAYAGLAFLLACVYGYRVLPTRRTYLLLLVLVGLYGVADELLQLVVPNRSADIYDWFADMLGAIAGLTAYAVVSGVVGRIRSR